MLNGKAKIEFHNWLYEKYRLVYTDFYEMAEGIESLVQSMIVEWFDTVGIFIDIDHEFGEDWTFTIDQGGEGHDGSDAIYDSRNQATQVAIEWANGIYNTRQKQS